MTDLTREQIEEVRERLVRIREYTCTVQTDFLRDCCDMALRTEAAERERDEMRKLAYVPGVWKCAKCGCVIVSTLIHAETGQFAANREPQQCPNNCGPMWMRTEREAGNELIDRLDGELEKRKEAEARISVLEAALRAILDDTECGINIHQYAKTALAPTPDRRAEG